MLEIFKERKSVRKYKNQKIEETKLNEILKAAILAPSGSNTQPWRYIVVSDEKTRENLARASENQMWMLQAPIYLVAVADIASRIAKYDGVGLFEDTNIFELKQVIRDTTFSISNILLEAENQGLASCVVAAFKQSDIRPILNIPDDKFVVSIITIGYAEYKYPHDHKRKSFEEIVKYEMWE